MGFNKGLLLLLAFSGISINAFATPPSSVSLTYDLDKQVLHVSAPHPTDKLDKHYLRRIVIYRNDQEVDSVTLPFQKSPAGLEQDISVAAAGGDKLSVDVMCSKGGSGKADVNVPIPVKEEKK